MRVWLCVFIRAIKRVEALNTISLNNDSTAKLTTNANGLVTFDMISGHEATGQLVKLNLLVMKRGVEFEPNGAIDWLFFIENESLQAVLPSAISSLILNTTGVQSVDISRAQYQLTPAPAFAGICFTTECETEQEVSV